MYKRLLADFGFAGAFTAVVALVFYLPSAVSTNHATAALVDSGPAVLDRTIYIEADGDRQAMGYEGYTLSPRDGGFRVEIVGAERHEGTILIDVSETYASYTVTRDGEVRVMELFSAPYDITAVQLDGQGVVVTSGSEQDLAVATLVPYIEASPSLDLLASVLQDANFGDTAGPYMAIPLLVIVPIVIGAIIGIATIGITWHGNCVDWHAECQAVCWDPANVYCQNWDFLCFAQLPDEELILTCRHLYHICQNNPNNWLACGYAAQENCATIVNGCPEWDYGNSAE